MADKKLCIEFRVWFRPSTNQDMLSEMASMAREEIFAMFKGTAHEATIAPVATDVTYTLKMFVNAREQKPT